ncbi:TetR/AcrR family transcriptional regulator [Marinobacter sp. JSM 1782161]|uniref:TetR/AcrR family transcriptional regulator n=1 Tax=Marinobacter sp. JSM 1782161 TaxID=2685906 RepID=UPI001402F937|nr:TetR family transcriptional regulator [Marinobacter sp. JSM 1782161]
MARANHGEATRNKILTTALALYARHGLDGVSLRTISAESGTRNSAAAHYHFGSRLGLLEAVVTHITDHTRPQFETGFTAIEAAPAPSLRDVVKAMTAPYLALTLTPDWGPAALRFMAHLHADNTPEIAQLLNRHFRPDIERIEAQLCRSLPDVPRDVLRIRLAFTVVSLIHGAAEIDLLSNTPFGNIRPDDHTLFTYFVDFIEGGLAARPAPH